MTTTIITTAPSADEHPVRIFRLPYANELYLCTCGADVRSDCSCSQETILTTHYNRHLRNPEVVAWVSKQSAPFTVREAAEGLGLVSTEKDAQLLIRMHVHREMSLCGCTYDASTKRFTLPGADTLLRLRLRPLAGSQSRREESQQCPTVQAFHPAPSPVLHADHQSDPVDPTVTDGLPTPRKSA